MPPSGKRAAEEAAARPNKRARQRELKRSAHQIAVQHRADGPSSAERASGHSAHQSVGTRHETATAAAEYPTIRLPAQLQADQQLAKYAFEAKALLKAIRTSSVGSSVRAWQMMPRHKRRRNASHNLLALPKRLRAKGRSELRASNTEPRSRSDVRRRKGKGDRGALGAYPRRKEGKRGTVLIERSTQAIVEQRAWLETHLWHAKRFRMSARQAKVVAGEEVAAPYRWGYSLAEESNAKSFRSSWRDDQKQATVLDRSYESWFRVSATVRRGSPSDDAVAALSCVLKRCGLQHGWEDEWKDGKRLCDTIMTAAVRSTADDATENGMEVDSLDAQEAQRAQAPVQVIWTLPSDAALSGAQLRRERREVLLSTHPACAAQLERILRRSIVPALRGSELHARVDVVRLNSVPHPFISAGSGAVGRRHASAATRSKAVMKAPTASQQVTARFARALQDEWKRQQAFNVFEVGGPSAGALLAKVLLPVGGASEGSFAHAVRDGKAADGDVIVLDVHDPRLSFPPRPRRPTAKAGKDKAASEEASNSARSTLLTHGAALPRFSSGEIQSRRSTLPTPGARLLPTSRDDRIPVILLRRASASSSTWTLLVPRGWGKAFWLSLVQPGTRVLGQVQLHALRFDKGLPTFPHDWVGTAAYERAEDDEAQRAFQEWQRTPPAKRCNYDRTGARWPFGGKGMWLDVLRNGIALSTSGAAPTLSRPPWLYAAEDDGALDALIDVYITWKQDGQASSPMPDALRIVQCAVLCVRVVACRKGSFAKWDEVHSISGDQRSAWLGALTAVQSDAQQRQTLQRLEQHTTVDPTTQIGSVTTSHFSLSNGRAVALASISLLAFLNVGARQRAADEERASLVQQPNEPSSRLRNPIVTRNIVLLRSVKGGPVRAASLEPVSLRR